MLTVFLSILSNGVDGYKEFLESKELFTRIHASSKISIDFSKEMVLFLLL